MSRKLALIIGNSQYDDPGLAGLPPVEGLVRELSGVLQDPDIGAFDDVVDLVDESLSVVRRSISRFFDQRRRDDLLVFYFSGYGIKDETGQLYLAVRDTEPHVLAGTAVEAAFVTAQLDRSYSRRQVVILDCANSGAFTLGSKASPGSLGTGAAFEGIGAGRVVLTSTDSVQYAWEGDERTRASGLSVFTHYLLEGLRTGDADRDEDGLITVDELYDYTYQHVVSQTPGQTPGKWSYNQQSEIVIAKNRKMAGAPAGLAGELREAIESRLPSVRLAAASELATLMRNGTPQMAIAARRALEMLTADDSRKVSAAAAAALAPDLPGHAAAASSRPRREDPELLQQELLQERVEYANAKVVLVGDTGVGKSGLALVLSGQTFSPTESTHGRIVRRFDSRKLSVGTGRTEIRETVLWDLAGQPGYRLVHQLELKDAAAAVVVFDARSETDPLAGTLHWVRALKQAQEIPGNSVPRLLVAARADRAGPLVSKDRIDEFMEQCGFHGYYETSAREGWQIVELRDAIGQAIDWNALPKVSSNALFERIKTFVDDEVGAHRVLSRTDDLFRLFLNTPPALESSASLRAQFETCLGRLESLGLIRRLSFGNFVLLKPELLAGFASALINAARTEPDGLGSIAEERARSGDFYIPDDAHLHDKEQKRLLLIATVEDLIRHEIALREGTDLVFPSQFTRENPELPDPEGKAIAFEFEGSLLNIYATLAVRLAHTGLLKKKELWKNAASFTAWVGGTAGMSLRQIEEGRGELTLFFDGAASEETRFQFEEYIRVHLERRAVPGTLRRRRILVCGGCRTPISDLVAARRRDRGFDWLACPVCDARVSLRDREERLAAVPASVVVSMDTAADSRRVRETAVSVLQGKVATGDFDVFLCHHAHDKPAVKQIGKDLKLRGVLPWLDEWELRPGLPWQRLLEQQISKIRSAAVFVGKDGLGPWQQFELEAFLREFVNRNCPVIPALLPDAPRAPELPIFLRGMTWVDFRQQDPAPTDQLIWGITGERGGLHIREAV